MRNDGQPAFKGIVHEVDELAVRAVVSVAPLPAGAPTVVLVHGLGLSHRYMMPLAEELARLGCRVYVPDLPGFGGSGHPPEVLDVPGLADGLANWMRVADVERATLVANSFGCQILADLAARYPDRVERAVLQGPTTPSGERTTLHQFIRWRQNSPNNPPELGPIAYSDYHRCGYPRVWKTFRHSLRDRMEDKLPRIRAPVLVVRGQRDPICRAEWAADVTERLLDGRLVEIPGVAHTLCYTAPVQLGGLTMQFIDEARQGGPRRQPLRRSVERGGR